MSAGGVGYVRATDVRWVVFFLACITSWLTYLHRYIFGLIKPKLVEEWSLGNAELGLLDSGFSVFYTGLQFPLGVLADLAGVHLVLTALIFIWSCGLGLHAWAPSVRVLWYGRALLGIGQSAAFAALNRVTRIWFAPSIRTSVQGWVAVFSARIGGFSATMLFAAFALGYLGLDWRTAVYIFAGIGIVHAFVFGLVFRDSPRSHPWVNEAEVLLIEGVAGSNSAATKPALPKMTLQEMLSRTSPRSLANLAALNVQTILSTAADNIYSNWIPLFLWQVHKLEYGKMGMLSSLPLLGGALGGAAGGMLNDLLIWSTGNRRWARIAVGLGGKGIAAVLLLLALYWYDRPLPFCTMLIFVKVASDSGLSTTWGTVTDIGGRATASIFAFNNSVAGVGSIGAPILFGAISQYYGWKEVFLTGAGLYALCAVSWLAIDCTLPVVREEARG